MDRIRDTLHTPETGEGASDFVAAGLSLVGRDLEEVSLDANPPGPVSLETVLVRVIRLVHHDSRSAEVLRKERVGRVSGELVTRIDASALLVARAQQDCPLESSSYCLARREYVSTIGSTSINPPRGSGPRQCDTAR